MVSNICYAHPYLEKWSNLTFAYFSDGLKPPTRLFCFFKWRKLKDVCSVLWGCYQVVNMLACCFRACGIPRGSLKWGRRLRRLMVIPTFWPLPQFRWSHFRDHVASDEWPLRATLTKHSPGWTKNPAVSQNEKKHNSQNAPFYFLRGGIVP